MPSSDSRSSPAIVRPTVPAFLAGGGEMGERLRAFDWSGTALGAVEGWPAALRTTLRILLSTNHPVFLFWGSQHLCFYNDAYARSLGPEQHPSMLGAPGRQAWDEIWHIIGPQIDQVMSGGGATWHENHLVPLTRRGRLEEVYWTYSYGPVDDDSAPGGIGGVLVLCTETTAQVLAERRLQAAQERWRSLFDEAPGFICVLAGPDHRFEYANRRYRELVAGRPVIGRTVAECLPEVAGQGFIDLLDGVFASGRAYQASSAPIRLSRADGSDETRYLDFVYEPVRDDAGTVTGVFVEGTDVTARTKAMQALGDTLAQLETRERELRDADRRKDEFLATLAHELRNPLAPLRIGLEILERGSVGRAADEARAMMRRQLLQMVRLIDDLLDVSRIRAGKLTLRRELVPLSGVIDVAIEGSRPALEAAGHRFEWLPAAEPLWVHADLTRMAQVVGNLLHNAARYTPAGGWVLLSAVREGDEAVIRVADSGVGLAPQALEQVFRMFAQVDPPAPHAQAGLGIGLALARSIVELHEGTIEAASEGPGRGCTFTCRLPLALDVPPPLALADDGRAISAPAPRGLQVLIVDDNRDAADSLSLLLSLAGHRVRTAYDGPQALAMLPDWVPDAALIDIGMPGMDGCELARALRSRAATAGTLLVAVTGWGNPQDEARSRAAGFDAHLTKPVGPESVEALLATRLARP